MTRTGYFLWILLLSNVIVWLYIGFHKETHRTKSSTRITVLKHPSETMVTRLCGNESIPKVAILLVGSVRGWLHADVQKAQWSSIIQAFGAQPYLFPTILYKKSEQAAPLRWALKSWPWTQMMGINATIESAQIWDSQSFSKDNSCAHGHNQSKGRAQTRLWNNSYRMARTYEQVHNVTFDWFMYVRTDIVMIPDPLQPFCAWDPYMVALSYDYFALVPRVHSETFFGMWPALSACIAPFDQYFWNTIHEFMVIRWLGYHGVPFVNMAFHFNVVRSMSFVFSDKRIEALEYEGDPCILCYQHTNTYFNRNGGNEPYLFPKSTWFAKCRSIAQYGATLPLCPVDGLRSDKKQVALDWNQLAVPWMKEDHDKACWGPHDENPNHLKCIVKPR